MPSGARTIWAPPKLGEGRFKGYISVYIENRIDFRVFSRPSHTAQKIIVDIRRGRPSALSKLNYQRLERLYGKKT